MLHECNAASYAKLTPDKTYELHDHCNALYFWLQLFVSEPIYYSLQRPSTVMNRPSTIVPCLQRHADARGNKQISTHSKCHDDVKQCHNSWKQLHTTEQSVTIASVAAGCSVTDHHAARTAWILVCLDINTHSTKTKHANNKSKTHWRALALALALPFALALAFGFAMATGGKGTGGNATAGKGTGGKST